MNVADMHLCTNVATESPVRKHMAIAVSSRAKEVSSFIQHCVRSEYNTFLNVFKTSLL